MSWLLNTFAAYPPIKEPNGIAIVPILRITELMRPIYWFGITIWLIVANNMLVAPIGIQDRPNKRIDSH